MVIGTLWHAKIIMELHLQNDKAKAFSEGEDQPLNPPPLTLIKNEGEELIRSGKGLGWLTLLG